MRHNPNDPPLDRKARLMDDVVGYAVAYNAGDREKMTDAVEGVEFWIKQIVDHANGRAYDRSYSNVACCNSIIEATDRVSDLIFVANPEVNKEARDLLAKVARLAREIKGRDEAVTIGGGK